MGCLYVTDSHNKVVGFLCLRGGPELKCSNCHHETVTLNMSRLRGSRAVKIWGGPLCDACAGMSQEARWTPPAEQGTLFEERLAS